MQGEAGLGGGNGPQIEAANEEEEAQGLPGKSVLSGAEPLTAWRRQQSGGFEGGLGEERVFRALALSPKW